MRAAISMLVDYEGTIACRVAGDIWSGLSRAALGGGEGYAEIRTTWDSLREPSVVEAPEVTTCIFVLDQEHPEAVDALDRIAGEPQLYGLVLAVPDRPNPLAGSLLYQGVERLQESGVRAGCIEPALLRAEPAECERYAGKLLERLKVH